MFIVVSKPFRGSVWLPYSSSSFVIDMGGAVAKTEWFECSDGVE